MNKSSLLSKLRSVGPAALVTAAFIGPGTVTTCSIAGTNFGYALLWGLLFSVIGTIVLQEMAARLGIIGRMGLGEALRHTFNGTFGKILSVILIISAIAIGNAAYETGNLLGGALGLERISGLTTLPITDSFNINIWGPVMGIISFGLLILGSYKVIEKVLIVMVILMSFTFITTVILISPDITEIFKGIFIPSLPKGSLLTVIALIGTTVVPYNLFLHASAVQERWKTKEDLSSARSDTAISISVGGIISMSIVICSAVAFMGTGKTITGAADLATQLRPLLGSWADIFISLGLFAAGISSALTAPLASSYALSGILGWPRDMKDKRFKAIWMLILFTGIVLSAIGVKPIQAIFFAQITNGILLPIVAVYLIVVMNSKKIMGDFRNSLWQNILGMVVVTTCILLGLRSILHVLGVF